MPRHSYCEETRNSHGGCIQRSRCRFPTRKDGEVIDNVLQCSANEACFQADEAFCIGLAPSSESYVSVQQLVALLRDNFRS